MNEEFESNIELVENAVNEICEVEAVQAKSNTGKIIFGLGLLIAVGAVTWGYKNRDRFDRRAIAKLERRGYTILEPNNNEDKVDEEEVEMIEGTVE